MGTGIVILFVAFALGTSGAVVAAVAKPNMRRSMRRAPKSRTRKN